MITVSGGLASREARCPKRTGYMAALTRTLSPLAGPYAVQLVFSK